MAWYNIFGLAVVASAVLTGAYSQAPDPQSLIQNAVLEGIQLTSEPGKTKDEKIVTCYFIFRDKPSHYFFDRKIRQGKLSFEFHDTEMGSSPIPSQAEAPITGFEIERKKIDANADIRGLKPEWHDVVTVTFSVDAMPQITVTDQYNIISFSYPWSTDPAKLELYTVQEKKPPFKLIGIAGGGGAAVAAAIVAFWPRAKPPKDEPVPIHPLPQHVDYTQQR